MKTPTEFELQHMVAGYDPAKAHDYYERHKHLTGRKPGHGRDSSRRTSGGRQVANSAKAKQRKALSDRIQTLTKKLHALEAHIAKREHEEKAENRKSKAKKERAAKEKDKPKSAAEKAKTARENKQYRDKHKQSLKSKAKKDDKSNGGKDSKKKSKHSISELKSLATKVKGMIAVAKQKLAAL